MKLSPIRGWFRRWLPGSLPLLVSLVVIGIAFDVMTRSRLSATTGQACDGEYADSLQLHPMLDAAILKANQRLTVLPYKVGKSAALRQGNAVIVRGFPLGVMQAVSSGKVVNPYDRDQEQGWDHVDFVIDALLSEGNSGSPVLAASCKSRELELVGVYHAGYKGHGALNVVVGIDQLIDFMHKKRRMPRAISPEGSPGSPGVAERGRIKDGLAAGTLP